MGLFRAAFVLATALLPRRLRATALSGVLGWKIDSSARIGLSLFIRVGCVSLGERARIGHFNVFRDLADLRLGDGAVVGQWNWATAQRDIAREAVDGAQLVIGAESAITSRHYLDCSGSIDVGVFTIIGGVRSTILSHEVDLSVPLQIGRPVAIGDYCFVGSNVSIRGGTRVPNGSVIGMGAVVAGKLSDENTLYAGVPARAVKALNTGGYFVRSQGRVGSGSQNAPGSPM